MKLELGSGPKAGSNGWTTIDFCYGADISHDLRKGIPLESNSVNSIYSSHMLEHIPYKQLIEVINECKRVLKEGAELSICVPNASLYINSYTSKENFRGQNASVFEPAIIDTGSFIDQINYIAYMGGAPSLHVR